MKNSIIALCILALSGCGNNESRPAETLPQANENILELTAGQLESFPVTATALQEKNITQALRLNGKIEVPPQNMVSVSNALGGYVKSTRVLPGMHFQKGEILAVMEDNQYIQLQQDYLTVKARLQTAEAEFSRQKELNKSKASSDKILQRAEAEYQTLLISRQALEEKLRLIHIEPDGVSAGNIKRTIHIYAPFNGYVTQVFVNVGKYVAPSDVLFELVDPRDLHLTLKVFEKDWDKIRTGQPLVAYTNSAPDRKYAGKVILTGKNISEDRAMEIHAHLSGNDGRLIPGLYLNAEIEIPDNRAPALPSECILSFEGGEYIFEILGNNRFGILSVQTGPTGNGWTEIKNPEQLKDKKIVQSGAYTLLMALKNKAEE